MYRLKKNGKVFMSKFVGTGPSSYKKNNLPARGLTNLRNTGISLIGFLTVRDRKTPRLIPPNWKTTACRLSSMAFSVHSHVPFVCVENLPSAT